MKERQRSRDKKYAKDNNNSHGRQYRRDKPMRFRQPKDTEKFQPLVQINRNQMCPFLTRIYYNINNIAIYQKEEDLPKDRQIILYLWMNSTLKQITQLLRAHLPNIRTKQRFIFSKVYSQNDKLIKKQMGVVMVHRKQAQKEDNRLDQHKFCIGDYIDVSINFK